MKISNKMIQAIYSVSKQIYKKQTTRKKALDTLVTKYGMNRNSASDYINNFKHMMEGKEYTHTTNEKATEYFFKNILSDFGKEQFKKALNAVDKHIISYEGLNRGKLTGLRNIYLKYLSLLKIDSEIVYPDEIDVDSFVEGAKKSILVNGYERDQNAREECINYYGTKCSVCSIILENAYGIIGSNFIHVHHLIPLSEIGKSYIVNPIKDLRPVCPNCHAMLHRKKPAFTIEELKDFINNK